MAIEKKATGRPKKEIDKTEFEKLCMLQCTIEEICAFFDTTDKTITRWCNDTYGMPFSEIFAIKRGMGKISLRRNMLRLSEKNATMAIFLAKNWLGMTDNVEVKADTSLMSALLDVVQNKGEKK